MDQMRDANERLVVAAVRAQNQSDEAQTESARTSADLERLMGQLRETHTRLTTTAKQVDALAREAGRSEEAYRRLSRRLLQTQDEERRRLARDLHDSTGQLLAALTVNLDLIGGAKNVLGTRLRRALAQSRSLAEQCSREVRTLAYLLHPPLLDELGLQSALRWYVSGFVERSGIHVDLDVRHVGRLPEPIETALFRVVQESLTNIHRHASSGTASIRLTSTADVVVLDIQDQGIGLRDVPRRQSGAHGPEIMGVGIQGMQERVRELGGTFDIEFADTGTTVHATVPLNAGTP
jgi:signal transduction histidine kinase